MSKSLAEIDLGIGIDDRPGAAIDRRSFLASGAAAGAVAIAETSAAHAAEAIGWDREVDVVVIGAGAGGLVAANAAREKGASVLIVEKNFDIGGRAPMRVCRVLIIRGAPRQKDERERGNPGRGAAGRD